MADIALDLLEAIDTTLTTERQAGGQLTAVKSHFVLRTGADIPPEYGSRLPIVIVRMLDVPGEIISIPAAMTRKEYPVQFSVFTENTGNTQKTQAAEILDSLEDVFNQENFGLSDWVSAPQKSYNQTTLPNYSGTWNGAGSLTITHSHVDMRCV